MEEPCDDASFLSAYLLHGARLILALSLCVCVCVCVVCVCVCVCVCMQESLLEECLVTVQLYATHLVLKQESIDSLSKQLSSRLLEAGVDCHSSSLNRIYPMQLRTAVMNHLKTQVAH